MKTNSRALPSASNFTLKFVACLVALIGTVFNSVIISSARPAFDHVADAKEVVNKLVAEDFEGIRKNFNDTMKSGLSAEKMKEVWRSVIEHAGSFKSQGDPQSSMNQGWEIIVIPCQMERARINVEVDYDSAGKIGGLWIRPAQ